MYIVNNAFGHLVYWTGTLWGGGGGRWDGVACTGGGRGNMIDTRGLSKIGFYLQMDLICKIGKLKCSWKSDCLGIDLSYMFAVLKQDLCLLRPLFACCFTLPFSAKRNNNWLPSQAYATTSTKESGRNWGIYKPSP